MFKTKKNQTHQQSSSSLSVQENIDEMWLQFKREPNNTELRNRLIEHYMPIVYHRSSGSFLSVTNVNPKCFPQKSNGTTSFPPVRSV